MKSYLWLSDIHLNYLSDEKVKNFCLMLKTKGADGIFISGDISNSIYITKHLLQLQKMTNIPVYFTSGNHTTYHASFDKIETSISSLCKSNTNLHYLDIEEQISLSPNTGLIGSMGWYDAEWHHPMVPLVFIGDWFFIEDFKNAESNRERMNIMRDKAHQEAQKIGRKLKQALKEFDTIYLITHYPPWPSVKTSFVANFWKPFNSSKIIASYINNTMIDFPKKKLVVLSGHQHHRRYAKIADNIELYVADATLGKPQIEKTINI